MTPSREKPKAEEDIASFYHHLILFLQYILIISLDFSLSPYLIVFPFQHEHPYISAQVNNGSVAYDHDSDGTHSQVAGCTVSFMCLLDVVIRQLCFRLYHI